MRTFLAICVSANLAAPAFGQHLEAGSPRLERGGSSSLATLETLIEQLQGQLAEQRELIAKNAQEIAEQRVLIDTLRRRVEGPGLGPDTRAADVSAQANTPVDHRPDPELPQKFVTGGDFPGSIEIPGTDTAFKIGGQARSTFVHSLQPLGEDDRFITSSIPVASVRPGDEARTTYTAAPSRLNFDFRSPSPFGGVRTFVEYDFSGTGNAADLRHAFIQGNHWIFGQTWSTFSDPEAQPTDIDFEGLNAISLFRQPQIRYTHPLRERLNASVAVENPAPALTGAAGVNVVPDFVARLRWTHRSR